jgi:hypothetical protein
MDPITIGLLGAGAGAALTGSSKPSTTSGLTGDQKQLAEAIKNLLLGRVGDNNFPAVTPYPGQQTAQFPAWLTSGITNLMKTSAGGMGELASSQQQAALQQLSGKSAGAGLTTQATQDWYNKGVLAPAMLGFEQQIKPQIMEGFAAGGALNSRVGNALTQQLGNIQTQSQGQLASANLQNQQLMAQLQEAAYQRQLNAASSQGLAGFQGQLAGGLAMGYSPLYQQQQAELAAQYGNWQMQQPWASPYLNPALSMTGQNQSLAYNQPGIMQQLGSGFGSMGVGAWGLGQMNSQLNPTTQINWANQVRG